MDDNAGIMKSFRDRLRDEIVVFDGGVGTYLYEKGIYIHTCFDELNLTNADIVAQVHRDYVNAGADVVETNTFGANQFKLAQHGLEKKVYEINRRGAELALAATEGKANAPRAASTAARIASPKAPPGGGTFPNNRPQCLRRR